MKSVCTFFQVKMEILLRGDTKIWMTYNGLGSTLTSWMHASREAGYPVTVFSYGEDISGQIQLIHSLQNT